MGMKMLLALALSATLGLGPIIGEGTELPRTFEMERPDSPSVEEQGSMDAVLQERERLLKNSGLSYFYELYPGELGTLCVSGQTGTTHGTATSMLYVSRDGTSVEIVDLLPHYGFGACYYVCPRDISFRDGGKTLTFITPVKEVLDWEQDLYRDWGDTLCEFDTQSGAMRSMTPLE